MSAQINQSIENSIIFTDAAANKVRSLIEEEGNFNLNLRAFVTGGGCSGFRYGFTFDEQINDDDIVIKKKLDEEEDEGEGGDGKAGADVVRLLIDPLSFQYLRGAKIDYREDATGSQFIISNPNAKTTCGCGSSFAA